MSENPKNIAVKALTSSGPLLSGQLAAAVTQLGHLQGDAARQLIRRSVSKRLINSTYPVRFDRSFLYYLDRHKGKRFAEAVRKALPEKPSFERVFKVMLANKGFITKGQIEKAATCLPDSEDKSPAGRLTSSATIKQLTHLGIIKPSDPNPEIFLFGDDFRGKMIPNAAFRKVVELEHALFGEFREWIRRCYLLSWESHECRASPTSAIAFNKSFWDLAGPVYLGPFTKSDQVLVRPGKQAFLVAEVLAYRNFSKNDADAIIQRLASITKVWRTVPVIAIVLSQGYSEDAFKSLKTSGIVLLTLGNLFGRNIEELLRLYGRLIVEAPEVADTGEVDRSLELLGKAELDEDLTQKLRGDLFELIVAMAHKRLGFETQQQMKIHRPVTLEAFEIDIVASRTTKGRFVECKGRAKGVLESADEIRRHFEERCAAAVDHYGWDAGSKFEEMEAVFITSAELHQTAKDYLANVRLPKGIRAWQTLDRPKLLAFLAEGGDPQLAKLVEKYF